MCDRVVESGVEPLNEKGVAVFSEEFYRAPSTFRILERAEYNLRVAVHDVADVAMTLLRRTADEEDSRGAPICKTHASGATAGANGPTEQCIPCCGLPGLAVAED